MNENPLQQQPKLSGNRKEHFLKTFREHGLFNMACRSAGVCPETVRLMRKKDQAFEAEVLEAYRDFRDRLEGETQRRGMDGVNEAVYYQGVVVGHKKIYSDRLLELLLKRHIPAYRDAAAVDMTVQGGVLVVPSSPKDVDQWREQFNSNGDA